LQAGTVPGRELTMERYRPPDWRWDRVTKAVGNGRSLSRSRDDSHVQRGVKMLKALRDGNGGEEDIARRYPAEYEAHLIHTRREERGVRWMLQAGILARQTPEVLGEYLAIDPATVEAYEKLFFDVRDKLGHSGYIVTHVFEVRASYACDNVNQAISRWLAQVAYHAGWDAACHIWEANKPALEASQFLREALVNNIFTKAIDELKRNGVEEQRRGGAFEAALDVIHKEIEIGGPRQRTETDKALMGLMDSINIRILDPRKQLPAEEPRLQPVDPPQFKTTDCLADRVEANKRSEQEKSSGS